MTENTAEQVSTDEQGTEVAAPKSYEKGTWQAALDRSASLFTKSANDRKRASTLLWQGAKAAIADWENKSDVDVHAEVLYADVLDIMGAERKGDVSKIKTVALAVKNHGLDTSLFKNLSNAYTEARRLTVTVAQENADDEAGDKAVEAIAETAPASTTTIDGAALLLLSKGIDGAVVAILDALNGPSGANNEAAHRAFMRALSTEVAARIAAAKPQPAPKAGPKDGATQAVANPEGAERAVAKAPTKAKAPAKAKAGDKAVPVRNSRKTPNDRMLPTAEKASAEVVESAKPAETTETAPVEASEHAEPVAETAPVVKKRAVPVTRAS